MMSSRHSFVWWTLAAVVIVECVVRFVVGFELDRVLLVEATSFTFAAALLNSFSRRRTDLSVRARTAILLLTLAFILGAMRSALWLAGLEVQWANLAILAISLALFTLWWRSR